MNKIEDKLKEIFSNVFPNIKSEFDLDLSREKFENWDSLNHMQLVSEIESSFNITFEMDEIINIEKPSDFIKLIENKNG